MEINKPKAAWQSLGITAPAMALLAFVLQQWGGVVIPPDVQGYVVALADVLIPALIGLAIWGRARARAIVDRWF